MEDKKSPIWLLDIDGVLNVMVNRDTLEHPHWPTLIKKSVPTQHGVYYDLVMAPEVIDFINTYYAYGLDIQWATTWQHDANRFVAPAFDLPQMPVGASAMGLSDYYYKERAALLAIDQGRPLIWTDDDAIRRMVRMDIEESGVPSLLIEPDPRLGLTPEHLEAITAFVLEHASDYPPEP